TARAREFLDLVRTRAGITTRARVTSKNEFPTASGLASSASGYAALALAASKAAGLALSPKELSILARRGSGSAARSIPGTIAEANALAMHASAMAARPGVVYFQPATLAVHAEVRGLRACGIAAWATMDAGPHVKVLTTAEDAPTIAMRVKDIEGVTAVTI